MQLYILEEEIRPDMSLQRHLASFRSNMKEEESLAAGGYTGISMEELRRIALELKRSPSLSVLQPKHDTNEEFWRIANIPDGTVTIKVKNIYNNFIIHMSSK